MSSTKAQVNVEHYDVVIVGGGLVGAALACSLVMQPATRRQYRIALIEHQTINDMMQSTSHNCRQSVDDFEPRVSALTAASQQFLMQLGVWSQIVDDGASPYEYMKVWDGDGTADISFSAAELYQPALGHIVENSVIVRALHTRLGELGGVDIYDGCDIAHIDRLATPCRLSLSNGVSIDASLLVAADGANSFIRQTYSIPTREWDYNHHAIVATVKTEGSHQLTAWQRFSPNGPLAFLPLKAEQPAQSAYSSIVWSQKPEVTESLMALDDQAFCRRLSQESEGVLGDVIAVSRRYAIPLRQRHAKAYTKPGVVLLGDAAHTIHPLAGQGVNLGFLDVAVLADELNRAAGSGLPAAEQSTLQRYQRRRMGSNLAMMGLMEGFKQLYAADDPGVRWLRNAGMKLLNRTDFLKNQIVSHAMGLNVTLPELK